ncbi:MAG: hypothetical protein QOI55_847 [Actinomycetota bacterium]|nr:hypothetical protein [Actinomycetota bacterium]
MGSQWGKGLTNPDVRATASTMRAVWRAEQEADTADAADEWRHKRTVRDIALEAGHRGDPIVAMLTHVRFHGEVEAVGPDLLAIRMMIGRVDVHLHPGVPIMLQIAERVKEGGAREAASDGDFRSALVARERFGEVTLGCTMHEEPYDGRLVVGADHVCLIGRGGGETYFPFWAVAYVMPRRD